MSKSQNVKISECENLKIRILNNLKMLKSHNFKNLKMSKSAEFQNLKIRFSKLHNNLQSITKHKNIRFSQYQKDVKISLKMKWLIILRSF